MESERRKHQRIQKPLIVQYASEADGFCKWDMSTMKDLSAGGMLITTREHFSAGAILNFRFKLPLYPLEQLMLKGKVVCSENIVSKFGKTIEACCSRIEFIDINDEDREKLRQYTIWFSRKTGGGK